MAGPFFQCQCSVWQAVEKKKGRSWCCLKREIQPFEALKFSIPTLAGILMDFSRKMVPGKEDIFQLAVGRQLDCLPILG
jgi:hypothetical protein